MRLAVAVIIGLISAMIVSNVSAQEQECHVVLASGASVVQECGKQLNAFALRLLEVKLGVSGVERQVEGDLHGRFWFECPVEPVSYTHLTLPTIYSV